MATEYPLDEATLGTPSAASASGRGQGRIQRHAASDRAFHWVTAATMLVLLATSLLPAVGIRFAWVQIHWIAGCVLVLALLFHIVRALTVQRLRVVMPRPADLAELSGERRPGKYTLAQKLMHLGVTVALVTAAITGVLLMIKAGTPFFERDPYRFSLATWGWLTVLHDAAAFLSLFLVMVHIYFSLRPEKRMYLRAMVRGWVTREELRREHDPVKVERGE
jgi:formate dehydrogenase subunit gamma